jgi:hypothetical protein
MSPATPVVCQTATAYTRSNIQNSYMAAPGAYDAAMYMENETPGSALQQGWWRPPV